MIAGSSAAQLLSTIAAFGVSLCFATAASEARITQEAPSVICEELPAVTWPQGRSNTGRSFASVSAVEVRTHAVIMVEEFSVAGEGGLDLALQKAFGLRMRESAMALGRIGIGLCARNAEEMADDLGGLAHIQVGDGIGQPALEADDRLEIARTQLKRRGELRGHALAVASPANQRTPEFGQTSGAWLSASVPPARIMSAWPSRM